MNNLSVLFIKHIWRFEMDTRHDLFPVSARRKRVNINRRVIRPTITDYFRFKKFLFDMEGFKRRSTKWVVTLTILSWTCLFSAALLGWSIDPARIWPFTPKWMVIIYLIGTIFLGWVLKEGLRRYKQTTQDLLRSYRTKFNRPILNQTLLDS
ncbi:hypothetical protein HN958_02200 [Candidatus Falkowbacteria bacterium]|jgi:hypothetical protein|nr:hypothetical protein [Candidatus Falkowbacteria bacterium]